jgi:hypothetical protein
MIVDKLKYADPNNPQMKIPLFVFGLVQGEVIMYTCNLKACRFVYIVVVLLVVKYYVKIVQ